MQSKSIVLTGASGFIGRSCREFFIQSGFNVITVGRSSDNEFHCDLSSPKSVLGLSNLPDFDSFVHLGSYIGWDGSAIDKMYLPNIVSTALISNIVRERRAHFVFSSAAIIAGLNVEQITKTTPDNPDCPYAESKLLAELCIKASGVDAAILRIGGVYGFNGPHHLGLNRSIHSALSGNPPVVFGSGAGQRNYIYVADLASIISQVVQSRAIGTHLVSGPNILTIHQMNQLICNVFELDFDPLFRKGDSSRSQLISSSEGFIGKSDFSESLLSIMSLASRYV